MRFQDCAHATTLDLRLLKGEALVPAEDTASARMIQAKGDAHERAYLDTLKASGISLHAIDKDKLTFEVAVEATRPFPPPPPSPRPEPVAACDLCRWREHCANEWETTDSLCLVAGIRKDQRHKLEAAGVTTLAGLARAQGQSREAGGRDARQARIQARLQHARRAGGPPQFELRDHRAGPRIDATAAAGRWRSILRHGRRPTDRGRAGVPVRGILARQRHRHIQAVLGARSRAGTPGYRATSSHSSPTISLASRCAHLSLQPLRGDRAEAARQHARHRRGYPRSVIARGSGLSISIASCSRA